MNDSFVSIACEHIENEEYEQAFDYYREALRHSQNASVLIDAGVTLHNIGDPNGAIKYYDEVLKSEPQNIMALVNKGAALHSLCRYHEAVCCYNKALSIDDSCVIAIAYKGLSLGEIGFLKEAIKCFTEALFLDHEYDIPKINKEIALKILKEQKDK